MAKRALVPKKVKQNKVYVKLKLLLFSAIILLLVGTIGYTLLNNTDPVNGFVITLETLAFQHSEAPGTGASALRFVVSFLGAILIWFVLWAFFDLFFEDKLGDLWRDLMTNLQAGQLKNHYVICGAGRVGIHVAELLDDKNMDYVIIEKDKALAESLSKKGMLVIQGDALDEEVLKEAGIEKARAVVAVIPETEKNVLISLTSKHLNPKLTVYARAEKEDLIKQLHNAGVKHVVTPEIEGAREIVSLINKDEIQSSLSSLKTV